MNSLTAHDLFEYRGWALPGLLDYAFVAVAIGFITYIII